MVKGRKGFTLVELLIVIVIIGILASSMMLSSSSATASAEAANIISELRSLKAATIMFFADSMDAVNNGTANTEINKPLSAKTLLGKYMDNPEKLSALYLFRQTNVSSYGKRWFVGFDLQNGSAELKEKLHSKAASTGLFGTNGPTTTPPDTTAANTFTISHGTVWMVAR
jgi:general secretion pathway protein G